MSLCGKILPLAYKFGDEPYRCVGSVGHPGPCVRTRETVVPSPFRATSHEVPPEYAQGYAAGLKRSHIEDQHTVGAWARSTFGEVGTVDAALRVGKEAHELVEAAFHAMVFGNPGFEHKAHVELADVLITLYRLADVYDVDIHKLVDEKMAVNRTRKWKLDGRGGGQHIPEGG